MIEAIIFDWGRTLFDSDGKIEFPESEDILKYCKEKGYRLGLVSLTSMYSNAGLAERKNQIDDSVLRKYFEFALVTDTDKDVLFEQAVRRFDLPYENILVVDDRTARGIKWANQKGCQSVWMQKGKFADELPNAETGQPTHTIHNLSELLKII